jgi:hypothetical protein
VEALYGAYLLEPVPMFTGEGAPPSGVYRLNYQSHKYKRERKSYGRYSYRTGIEIPISFSYKSTRFGVYTGVAFSEHCYETTPFLVFRSIAEMYGITGYHSVVERLKFIEVPFGIHGKLVIGRFFLGAQLGFTLLKSIEEEYVSKYYAEWNYPYAVPFPKYDYSKRGYANEIEGIENINYVHTMPKVIPMTCGTISFGVSAYKWMSIFLSTSFDRQTNEFARDSQYSSMSKRLLRYGVHIGLSFRIL